jgi:predicted cupin superfamily sugar epimerase
MRLDPRAESLIRDLRLQPHVEGGFYREVFRSPGSVRREADGATRPALTTIYFLLPDGAISRWHRVTSDEVWHFYEGGGVDLFVAPPDCTSLERVRLGPALAAGSPVFTVPAHWWQAARPVGPYALAGCTVAPGFEFDDFRLMRHDPAAAARMRALGSGMETFI